MSNDNYGTLSNKIALIRESGRAPKIIISGPGTFALIIRKIVKEESGKDGYFLLRISDDSDSSSMEVYLWHHLTIMGVFFKVDCWVEEGKCLIYSSEKIHMERCEEEILFGKKLQNEGVAYHGSILKILDKMFDIKPDDVLENMEYIEL